MNGKELILLYINNSTDIFLITERCWHQCAKKVKKGVILDAAYLANSFTMKAIVRMACKLIEKNEEECTITKEDKRLAALEHANSIIWNANYIANH
mgnify:CR=1 FL=1|jgi:hypothetical protein